MSSWGNSGDPMEGQANGIENNYATGLLFGHG